VFLVGGSMGGHIALLGMQQFSGRCAGALAMCPSEAPTIDFLASVGAAALAGEPLTDVATATRVFGTRPLRVQRRGTGAGVPRSRCLG
jgi:hypothetical protein